MTRNKTFDTAIYGYVCGMGSSSSSDSKSGASWSIDRLLASEDCTA